jgi:hypothetical protein
LEDYYGDLEKPELEFTEMLGLPIWFSNMPCNDPICIFGRWVR